MLQMISTLARLQGLPMSYLTGVGGTGSIGRGRVETAHSSAGGARRISANVYMLRSINGCTVVHIWIDR